MEEKFNLILVQTFLIGFLIIFIFGMYHSKSNRDGKSTRCIKEFMNSITNGVVRDKYLDSNNHNFKTIEYERTTHNKIYFVNELSNLYEKIEVKDSLIFDLKTNVFYIFRLGKLIESNTLSFNCD